VKKCSASSSCPVYDIIRKQLIAVAVVCLAVPDDLGYSGPSSAQADYLKSFPVCPDCHCPDCRIKAGHITAPGKDRYYSFFRINVSHALLLFI
jgi:hypothetical protein